MPTERDMVGPVSSLLTRARNSGIYASAAVVQGKLDELTAAGASEETRTALYELVSEVFATDSLPMPNAPLRTVTTVQRGRWPPCRSISAATRGLSSRRSRRSALPRVERWWRD
ncbi:hypothetical protein D6T63_17565 [Arthrobacter cheniae]|uniref:Uncharacterized protein n=2 Tax=Arthrobacter cheniae TaxID=1258888 RepID=A0A3A5M1I9_9MICC|nr:hypothetical protein D6T63_17565 [Arthrobacter cheniae]